MTFKPDTHPKRTRNHPSLGPKPATLAITGCCPSSKTEMAALRELSVPRIDFPNPLGANTLESSPVLDMTS